MTDYARLERSVAYKKGDMYYFTGRGCKRGHIAKRRTTNGSCIECERENDRKRIRPITYYKSKYRENRERYRRYRKTAYNKYREKRIQETIQWQKDNPEKVNIKNSRWRKKNSGKVNAQTIRYRTRKSRAEPSWLTEKQRIEIREIYIKAVEMNLEVDHIIPLKGRNICGLHVPWNLQMLTKSENCSKGNKYV